jgi:hypothetical protein
MDRAGTDKGAQAQAVGLQAQLEGQELPATLRGHRDQCSEGTTRADKRFMIQVKTESPISADNSFALRRQT